ncbi:MAG: sugar transferase, partial [Pseudomonadota bacterium]
MKPVARVYRGFFKRALDVSLVLMSAPVTVPVVGLMALVLFLQDGRNPFYWQYRIGRAGRRFRFW